MKRTTCRGGYRALVLLLGVLPACGQPKPDVPSVAGVSPAADAPSPYVPHANRAVKALSEDEIAGLLEGRGLGFALVAELNGYPGPLHTLELAEPLELTATQVNRTREIFDEMKAEVSRAGALLVERERRLDGLFARGEAEAEAVESALSEIGALRARIRNGHVQAHLRLRPLLTEAQVASYSALRGYTGDEAGAGSGDAAPATPTQEHTGDHTGHH